VWTFNGDEMGAVAEIVPMGTEDRRFRKDSELVSNAALAGGLPGFKAQEMMGNGYGTTVVVIRGVDDVVEQLAHGDGRGLRGVSTDPR
jgi:hypothetical protein